MGLLERCRFVNLSADDLAAIADGSVDVVTTRSVLIYVSAKQKAFNGFRRVLKAGGCPFSSRSTASPSPDQTIDLADMT